MSTSLSDENMSHGDELPRSDALPANWSLSYLGDCGEVVMGQSPPGSSYNKSGVGMALINGPTEFTDRYPIKMQWTTQPTRFCETGDLLICVRGSSTGRTNYADEVYAIGRGVAAIRARGDNNTEYLSYQVIAGVSDILASATGSTFPSVDGKTFRRIAVALPPPSEQRAIAEALSDVDGLIGALEKLIAKKRSIKRAAMQQLLTGQTRLPGFSDKWERKRLGDICTCLPTANNPRADLSEYGDMEYIHYGDVHGHSRPVMDCSRVRLPRIGKDRIGSAAELQDGDLVLVDASEDLAGVGKGVEVQGLAGRTVVAGLHTILCRGNADNWAMGFKANLQFIPAYKTALTRVATGISVYGVSKSQLVDVELPLPSVREQKAIVAVLTDMDTAIEALDRRLRKTKQIKQGMMQQLLTGRIRLVTRQQPIVPANIESKARRTHSWAFNEAVVISVLAREFGSEEYPLGRKRYTKLSYLLHRHVEKRAEGYLKKAAGPYNPKTRYAGPERIAIQQGYVRQQKYGKYSGFVAADNIAKAEVHFEKWYGSECIRWLEQFRRKRNDDLELLTTVDMAAVELREAGKAVNVANVKHFIRGHAEWRAKLDRAIFSDRKIAKAIETSRELFSAANEDDIYGGT